MKTLVSVMVAALLAACGQGPQDIAQNPITQPEHPEPSNVEEADPSPQTLKPISGLSVTSPEGTPTQPEVEPPTEVKRVPPEPPKEEVQPTPRVPAPGQAELSEAEIIARKLISTDPGDNLEVLNEALERWLAEKGALPERVSDLVGEQFLPMLPMAPLGKAFMIDAENRRVIIIVAEK
jgi:ABC-type transport system substrate-binding protein